MSSSNWRLIARDYKRFSTVAFVQIVAMTKDFVGAARHQITTGGIALQGLQSYHHKSRNMLEGESSLQNTPKTALRDSCNKLRYLPYQHHKAHREQRAWRCCPILNHNPSVDQLIGWMLSWIIISGLPQWPVVLMGMIDHCISLQLLSRCVNH